MCTCNFKYILKNKLETNNQRGYVIFVRQICNVSYYYKTNGKPS